MTIVSFLNGQTKLVIVVVLLIILAIPTLIFLSFTYTLSFFEFLHKNDEHLTTKYKNLASICIFLVFFIPALFYIVLSLYSLGQKIG